MNRKPERRKGLDKIGPAARSTPPMPDDDWAAVQVTFTRIITVHVPRAAVPDGLPAETPLDPHKANIDFVTVVTDLVPTHLADLDPDDFGEITELMIE